MPSAPCSDQLIEVVIKRRTRVLVGVSSLDGQGLLWCTGESVPRELLRMGEQQHE